MYIEARVIGVNFVLNAKGEEVVSITVDVPSSGNKGSNYVREWCYPKSSTSLFYSPESDIMLAENRIEDVRPGICAIVKKNLCMNSLSDAPAYSYEEACAYLQEHIPFFQPTWFLEDVRRALNLTNFDVMTLATLLEKAPEIEQAMNEACRDELLSSFGNL